MPWLLWNVTSQAPHGVTTYSTEEEALDYLSRIEGRRLLSGTRPM
jgi:hypothetical protein